MKGFFKLFLPADGASSARLDRAVYVLVCVLLATDALRVALATAAASDVAMFPLADVVTITTTSLALIAIGWFGARDDHAGSATTFVIGLAVGLIFFARTIGLALADPTAIGWLMTQDWAQHYSGWAMFRHTPWHFPPGRIPEVWYPIGTSIMYTDSLPLLAFALKPFSTWLPQSFQYIGGWIMLSFMLQGGFGALLAARVGASRAGVLAGAALFVFAPVLVQRIGHDTLTAQWLLLAGFWLYFRDPPARFAADAWPWWLLSAIAALVHPYLAAMVLAIEFAAWWKRVRIDRARSAREGLAVFAGSIAIVLTSWWLCGALSIQPADYSGRIELGIYSMNLLAFVNPMFYSNLLPTLRSLPGQTEGFAYFGVGMLALLVVMLYDGVRERRIEGLRREAIPLLIVAFALLVFATGFVITLGSSTLLDLSFKCRILATFRSSGRFVWVAYYVLMLLAIVHVLRRYRSGAAAMMLAVALVLQIVDLSAAHGRIAKRRLEANADTASTRLIDPRWTELAAGRHHLTLLPPPACGVEAAPYLPMQLFAAEHGLTFNSGYLARWNLRETQRYCARLGHDLAAGEWSADDIYVVGDTWKQRFERTAPTAHCVALDGYDACVVEAPAPGSDAAR